MSFKGRNNSDRPGNAPDNASYPSDKHRCLFSRIVGHPTSIEMNLTKIEAHPTEVVIHLAIIETLSQTSKVTGQTLKLIGQR